MSVDLEKIRAKLKELTERHKAANAKKSEVLGMLSAKKKELSAVVDEIVAAGFDPKTIRETANEVADQLAEEMARYESELAKAEAELAKY